MGNLLNRLHAKLGDLWWYSLMIFVACRSGDVIQAFIGLWLVPKYVGPDELGAVLPLQQLSGLFAVPLAILATVFAKYVNTYATRGEYGKVKSFIRDVLLAACAVFVVCIAVAYVVIPHFYERLNVQAGLLTVLILAAGFAGNVGNLFTAALQGLKKFKTLTVQSLIGAPIRLVTLLVAMPIRALSGYILGQTTPPATCSLLAAWTLHRDLKQVSADTTWRKDLPEIWRYLWPVAAYTAFGALFGTISTTIYRQRLPEVESAAYYLLSRFSEMASYIGLTMAFIMVPLASESSERKTEDHKVLQNTLLATLGSTVLFAIMFYFLGDAIVKSTETWRVYQPYAYLLPALAASAGLAAAIGACVSYEMACRRFSRIAILQTLNLFWTVALVSLTGYEFFVGLLPQRAIDLMAAVHLARLDTLTYAFLIWNLLQLAFLIFSMRLLQNKRPVA